MFVRSILVSAILALPGSAVSAQMFGFQPAPPAGADVEPEGVAALMARAEQFASRGSFAQARSLYLDAAEQQQRDGAQAWDTFYRVANIDFFQRRPARAAHLLEQAAANAAAHGDVATQAKMLVGAALMYSDAGRSEEALECVQRIRLLMNSPLLPESERLAIARRIL